MTKFLYQLAYSSLSIVTGKQFPSHDSMVGNQLVSDGAYKTKEELIKSLENLNLETICKIIAGAIGRMIELTTKNEKQ